MAYFLTAMNCTVLEISTEDEFPVIADLYSPNETSSICVLCHGFKGHRKWGFFPYMAENISLAGIAALCMDFSHNGTISRGEHQGIGKHENSPYTDLELFRKNTLRRECSDLADVIRYILAGKIPSLKGKVTIGLFGHSRGAISVVLNAISFEDVKAICTWSMPTHPDVFSEDQKQKWKDRGTIEFTDSYTGTAMTVDRSYLDDIENNRWRYNILRAVKDLRVPHLIVHGNADLPIPPQAALKLFKAEKHLPQRRIVLVKSSHTLGITDSSSSPGIALQKAKNETVLWFKRHLKNSNIRSWESS